MSMKHSDEPIAGTNELPPPSQSTWSALKEAIRGSEADYTKISVKRAIFLLSMPMVLKLIMESTFAIADIFFVGKLGPSDVATVGLTETYLFLLYSIVMGLSNAAATLVGQNLGASKPDRAETSIWQIGWYTMAYLVAISLVFYSLNVELISIFSNDPEVIRVGSTWLRVLSYSFFVYG
jgi:Na+-driven multidrug efflux pump